MFRFDNTLKNNIILYFSIIFIIIISFIALAGYWFFSNVLTREILNYAIKLVDEATLNIDSYFSQVKYIMQITASNATILNSLSIDNNKDYIDKLHIERKTSDAVQDVLKFSPNIRDFIIIGRNGTSFTYSGRSVKNDYNFLSKDWMPKFEKNVSKVYFTGVHDQDYYLDNKLINDKVVSAVIPVIDYMSPRREFYGLLLSNLNLRDIPQIDKSNSIRDLSSFLILDDKNDTIYCSMGFKLSENFKANLAKKFNNESDSFILKDGGKDMLVVFNTSKITGWKFITLISREHLLQPLSGIKTFSIFLIIISIFIVVAASILISEKISKPIVKLINHMRLIEEGNFSVKLYDKSTKEIEMLSSRMDLMIERINKLNRDIYLYNIKNKEAELKALQAQINPHFLYNTLQSIKALSIIGKRDDVGKLTTVLGNMLRYTAYGLDELVPIGREISHVRDYLQIQSVRYEGRFTYSFSCSEYIAACKTLKLILQPIVENTVIHGLDDTRCICIDISVEEVPEGIIVNISDDGIGMDNNRLEKIKKLLHDGEKVDNSGSIGLKNVHSRIRLKFGGPYGLRVDSRKSEGTSIRILIPKIQSDLQSEANYN